MKRLIGSVAVVLVLALLLCNSLAFAEEYNSLRKLSRGVANTAAGFFWELFHHVETTFQDEGVVVGATYGVGKGVLKGIGRTLVGAFEIFTFFISSDNYEPIIDDPEFPFQMQKLREADYQVD